MDFFDILFGKYHDYIVSLPKYNNRIKDLETHYTIIEQIQVGIDDQTKKNYSLEQRLVQLEQNNEIFIKKSCEDNKSYTNEKIRATEEQQNKLKELILVQLAQLNKENEEWKARLEDNVNRSWEKLQQEFDERVERIVEEKLQNIVNTRISTLVQENIEENVQTRVAQILSGYQSQWVTAQQQMQQQLHSLHIEWQNALQQERVAREQAEQKLEEERTIWQKKNKELEERLEELETIDVPPIFTEPSSVAEPRIVQFSIMKNEAPFFQGNKEDICAEMEKSLQMDNLLNFLNNSGQPQAGIWKRNIERFQDRLRRFYQNYDLDDEDESEWSEALSTKFFTELFDRCLDNMLIAIYRGWTEDEPFYQEFLVKWNDYLTKCHISTRLVRPSAKMTEEDYDDMNPILKDTQEVSDDKMIDEVEKLPYYLYYTDDVGDLSYVKRDGSMIVLHYKKEA